MIHDTLRKKDEGLELVRLPGQERGTISYPDAEVLPRPLDDATYGFVATLPHDADYSREWMCAVRKDWSSGNSHQNHWTYS